MDTRTFDPSRSLGMTELEDALGVFGAEEVGGEGFVAQFAGLVDGDVGGAARGEAAVGVQGDPLEE